MPDHDETARARQAAAQAEEFKEAAVEARDEAQDATGQALSARDDAATSEASARRALVDMQRRAEESPAIGDELLMEPEKARPPEGPNPFGRPGPPISRRSPFYIGFVGTVGVLVALLLGMAIRELQSVLVLVVLSLFLAVGLNPAVEFLITRGVRRRWAVLLVTLGVLLLLTLFVVTLIPVIRDQIEALIANAPGWLEQLRTNGTVRSLDQRYGVIDTIQGRLQDPTLVQRVSGGVFAVGIAVVNGLLNAFLIFVLTLYFLSALPTIKRACYMLVPPVRRERVGSLGDEILRRVGGYVAGAFVIALCAGITSFIFLQFAGLSEYAVALSLVVALLDFIPLVGATIGAALVTIIGFATSPTTGIACLIFYAVYQQLENYVIYPRVMRSSVDVPGVVTVVAVLIGGTLMGVVGALLAIPTAAAILLLLRETVVRRRSPDSLQPASAGSTDRGG
ncbi:MAG: Uncharacterized UPF0118 membrane protein [uncultured Nocardioidaceae bacterium]|uniref:Uncharacterized UPF0118 membrane protein n=1 Tax=uncultured Nocardioidaceae bacterium TaxID=253824 RepID=A0A6J4N158_9ACTN|nr:MAG: Uncharacterized UPF0118 membrane protein [uncultured Nocardioidaceae bacterium]